MDLVGVVQGCVNQYLKMEEVFKQQMRYPYRVSCPNMVDLDLMSKVLYLTIVLNHDVERFGEGPVDLLDKIKGTLKFLYEVIQGYWDGVCGERLNLWKYKGADGIRYSCFFLQLLGVFFNLKQRGDVQKAEWIRRILIDLPMEFELSAGNEELFGNELSCWKNSEEPKMEELEMEKLNQFLIEYADVFNIPTEENFRLDWISVRDFYEKYFYAAYMERCKNGMFTFAN